MTTRRWTHAALLAAATALGACANDPGPAPGTGAAPGDAPVDAVPPATEESALSLSVADLQQGDDGLVRGSVRLAGDAAIQTVALRLAVTGGAIAEWARDDAFLVSGGGQVLQAIGEADATTLELAVATTRPATLTAAGAALATFAIAPTQDDVHVALQVDGDRGVIRADGTRVSPATHGAALQGVRR